MKKMTGRMIAAGRALVGVSPEEFAQAAGVSLSELLRIESNGSARLMSARHAEGIAQAFERFGVVAIDEDADMGAGVRLKFTRQDVRQIARLEGEGGVVGADDNP